MKSKTKTTKKTTKVETQPQTTKVELKFWNVFLILKSTLITVFGTLLSTLAIIALNIVLFMSAYNTQSIAWSIGISVLLIIYTNLIATFCTLLGLDGHSSTFKMNEKIYFLKEEQKIDFIIIETVCVIVSALITYFLVW